jgi:predicted peptidase
LVALTILATTMGLAVSADPAGKQEEKHFEKEITIKVGLNYLIYLPDGYEKEDKPWPLVLFLHGAGESGKDLNMVKVHGPPKMIAAGKSIPAIVVSPQSPRGGWDVNTLNALIDDVVASHKVDKDRIYLTGLSMGGFGTWALAAAHPEKFAAIVPICGGGTPDDAKKMKDLPIWVFHGAKDKAVPLARSEAMVKALKEAGAEQVKFTVYPNAEHDSWTETYNNQEMWDWLFKPEARRSEEGIGRDFDNWKKSSYGWGTPFPP